MTPPISTQFDIPQMFEVYNNEKNYEILNFDSDNAQCIIYFSSHALYYPNTEDIFYKKVIQENRFEWKKNILTSVKKVILIRDVKKQWYLEGINSNINSIEKLAEFLKAETKGLNVVCVGSSAGGYAATVIGCLIQADHVLCFSGQFSLEDRLTNDLDRAKNPTLIKYENVEEYRQYYSLIDLVKGNQVPIFYFYPGRCEEDIYQSQLVKGVDQVYPFPFKTANHGETCYLMNFLDIFVMNKKQLKILQSKLKGKMISPFIFSLKVSGYQKTFKYLFSRLLKKLSK